MGDVGIGVVLNDGLLVMMDWNSGYYSIKIVAISIIYDESTQWRSKLGGIVYLIFQTL